MDDVWTLDIERADGVVSLIARGEGKTKALDLAGEQFEARKGAICGALRSLAEAIEKHG